MRVLRTLLLVTACGCGSSPAAFDAGVTTGDGGSNVGADGGVGLDTDAGQAVGFDAGASVDAGGPPDASVTCPVSCGPNATCEVGAGAPRCVCNTGYVADGGTCTDLDECQAGASVCGAAGQCHNAAGSYFCECGPGQVWNGATCEQAGVRKIGSGAEHVCRIDALGEMRCWGKNTSGQLGDGTKSRRNVMTPVTGSHVWKSVTVFRDTTCAIDTGSRLWCWGLLGGVAGTPFQASEPTQAGSAADWVQVSVGEGHICGLHQDGALTCWGANSQGQLGVPSPTFAPVDAPVQVEPGTAWGVVAAGVGYTCAVKRDGSLWCWGANTYGNLGDGTLASRSTPTRVGSEVDWRTVDTGAFYTTCGIRLDGNLWCWGQNVYGQVVGGTDTKVVAPQKQAGPGGWRSVDSGSLSTCGTLFNDTVSCWGRIIGVDATPLGTGTLSEMGPVKDAAPSEPGAVGARFPTFVCAQTKDDSTWCWGQNNDGQLAIGSFANKAEPERVGQATWSQIGPGAGYTCGLRQDGTLWCWGGGSAIQWPLMSAGQPILVQSPVQVDPGNTWRSLSVGAADFCGVKNDKSLWCAGGDFSAKITQFGTDQKWASVDLGGGFYITTYWLLAAGLRDDRSLWSFVDSTTQPVTQFGTLTDWDEVAISRAHACGRRAGSLWCWFQSKPSDAPRQVGTTSDWKLVRSSAQFTTLSATVPAMGYGIRTDGTMWSWTATASAPLTPTPIGQGTTWDTLDVGPGFICAIATDHSLWCWGETDISVLLATGEIKRSPEPVRVGTSNDWAQIELGRAHLTALKTDGSLWAWGFGENGELGQGDAWRQTPTRAR